MNSHDNKNESLILNDNSFWPDPLPTQLSGSYQESKNDPSDAPALLHINDVSRMSGMEGTPVSRIFFPHCETDVLHILEMAHKYKKSIGIRGTKHSMGGHSIVTNQGWEIDTQYLNFHEYTHMGYMDKQYGGRSVVRCGPGCLWSDIIRLLNSHGKSPRTMQSYCSFSVGGTLAVNAHGITTDFCFAESVLEFKLARINEKGAAEIVVCRPWSSSNSSSSLSTTEKDIGHELFRLALGGYGLFGIMTETVLKVSDNVQLELDSLSFNLEEKDISCDGSDGSQDEASLQVPNKSFVRVYDNCREGANARNTSIGKVEIKLARFNILNPSKISLYLLRRTSDDNIKGAYNPPMMSDLPIQPKGMSPMSQLLYKWALPVMKRRRYEAEEKKGEALDWDRNDSMTKNEMLFESAVPLSKLYQPLMKNDDTFVLQEFFVPKDQFYVWIEKTRPIYKDIEKQQHDAAQDIILLNTTIRFVERDDLTLLSYSRHSQGVFAFVLYYRVKRAVEVDKRLGKIHDQFVDITLEVGGTFYLPYRRNYSHEKLSRAYPMIAEFAKLKEQYDPSAMFQNLWFEHYVLPLCSLSYQDVYSSYTGNNARMENHLFDCLSNGNSTYQPLSKEEFWEWLPRKENSKMIRRTDSYRNLLRSKKLRDEFRHLFLVKIFNIADPDEVMRVMTRASYDPANSDDIDIYRYVYNYFHGSESDKPVLSQLLQGWRALQQIRAQKEELTRQTASILTKLGKIGSIHNYCCVGDNGKTIINFVKEFNMRGKMWVVHDSEDINQPIDKLPSLGTVLERGSLGPVAHEEISYDYITDSPYEKLNTIPSQSVDLVTMNQGLHHIPLERLYDFLTEIYRILRPGSIFIVREHDLESPALSSKQIGKTPYPMLDLAHSIFNAVTGVSISDEENEVRAFRPIIEWRSILEKIGFVDAMIYEVEDGDPTQDEMIAFIKPKNQDVKTSYNDEGSNKHEIHQLPCIKDMEIPAMHLINTFLGQIPEWVLSNSSDILKGLKSWLPIIEGKLKEGITLLGEQLRSEQLNHSATIQKVLDIIENQSTSGLDQLIEIVDGLFALLSRSEVQKVFNVKNISNMPELFLILPYVDRKVMLNKEECSAMEVQLIDFVKEFLPSLLSIDQGSSSSIENKQTVIEKDMDGGRTNDTNTKVIGEEIKQSFEILQRSIPDIMDSEKVLVNSGFSLPQQVTLVTRFGGKDEESTFENLAWYLDRKSWEEIKHHLTAVAQKGDLPTKQRLLYHESPGMKEYHPWHFVLKSFLKSRNVQLTQQGIFGLRMMGLNDMGALYEQAKKEVENDAQSMNSEQEYKLSIKSNLNVLDESVVQLGNGDTPEVKDLRIEFTEKTNQIELWDVAEIIEATFGYVSLTSRKTDVTKSLQDLHSQIHQKLINPDLNVNIPKRAKVGWIPIDESWLIEVRNKGDVGKEFGDTVRKKAVQVASLGMAGRNVLKIKYRRIVDSSEIAVGYVNGLKSIAQNLENVLASEDIIPEDLHKYDGEYTWYKLNEWMQVEILDQFVQSLDHTAWYRFPFMSFLRVYFEVFLKQSNIVREKYGLVTAYGSMAFLTDLIPGVVMGAFFAQLKMIAYPLELMTPIEGMVDADQSRSVEQCILHLPPPKMSNVDFGAFIKDQVDERIVQATVLPHNFVVLNVPPFKVMGEILQKISVRFPSAKLLSISNQYSVQVRVSLAGESIDLESPDGQRLKDKCTKNLSSIQGVKLMMDYRFPNTKNGIQFVDIDDQSKVRANSATYENVIHLCFDVQCVALLCFFRSCQQVPHCKVEQVYDFWN